MPAITIKDLAEGIKKVLTKAEKDKLAIALAQRGRSAACSILCSQIRKRTGLNSSLCKPVCNKILTEIAKNIRGRL